MSELKCNIRSLLHEDQRQAEAGVYNATCPELRMFHSIRVSGIQAQNRISFPCLIAYLELFTTADILSWATQCNTMGWAAFMDLLDVLWCEYLDVLRMETCVCYLHLPYDLSSLLWVWGDGHERAYQHMNIDSLSLFWSRLICCWAGRLFCLPAHIGLLLFS